MNKQKVMEIVLSSQSNDGRQEYSALLILPATTHEIRDACQRARFWDYLATPKYINILQSDCPRQLDNYDLAEPATVEELNFFASRVEELPEYQKIALEAVFSRYSNEGRFRNGVSVKDLINLTYGLGDVIVVEGITSDSELGDYVIDNDLHPDVSAVPDGSVYLLDSAAIGRLQRENDQGMFIDDYYVATANYEMSEVYNGRILPDTRPPALWYAFKLKVADAPIAQPGDTEHRAAWLALPMEDDAVTRFAKSYNEERIEDCVCYGMISGIPQITEQHFYDMRNFHKLNSLAWRMTYMSSEEQCRFKAALELEKPETMDEVMDIAENLHRYEFSDTLGDEDSYFRRILAIFLPPQFDKHWLDNVYFHKQGEQMLNMVGGMVTSYGVISGRDQSLYQMLPRPTEEPAKTLKTQALTDERLQVVEVLGMTALFSNGVLTQHEIGDSLCCYELRECNGITSITTQPQLYSNFGGMIVLKHPLDFGDLSAITLEGDNPINFLDETMTVQEYMDTDFEETPIAEENEDEDLSYQMGGMQL